jgi:hypothetical protein
LKAVEQSLGMDVESNWVGFREKRFDACNLGGPLPSLRDCHRAYFVQIGVQLSCRPNGAEGSVVLNSNEPTPLSNQKLFWRTDEISGDVQTDQYGFAHILTIGSASMKGKGLRISTGTDFLVMRAQEATSIVTPADWCQGGKGTEQ